MYIDCDLSRSSVKLGNVIAFNGCIIIKGVTYKSICYAKKKKKKDKKRHDPLFECINEVKILSFFLLYSNSHLRQMPCKVLTL